MRALVLTIAVLAGCASSPEYVESRSNFDVCRLTMRGPHARNAEAEAARRGLNCLAYYPAINGKMANDNAAIQQILTPAQVQAPRPQSCTSYRVGNSIATDCN